MQVNYFGNGQKKIMVVHGFMHSYKRYVKLAEDLSSVATVALVTLSGFGGTKCHVKENIIDAYVKDMVEYLDENECDLIIGHSLGGNIVLKTLEASSNIKSSVLLLNPAYFGIDQAKFIVKFPRLNNLFFSMRCKLPRFICKPFIKIFTLISVNKYSLIDDILIDDVRSAQPLTATQLIKELAVDTWRASENIKNNITVVMSEKDRIISSAKIRVLLKDLKNARLITFKKTGHTSILENYDDVLKIVLDILGL